jgi:hypothetical protein
MSDTCEVTFNEHHGPAVILAEVLGLTSEMISAAHDDRWDEVAEMEEKRRAALGDCFRMPIEDSQSELFSEAIAAMLHMNEELIALLETAKKAVAVKRTNQRFTRNSVGRYIDIEKG